MAATATNYQTFVLVHGMWHGGWCWAEVAEILRGRGHRVTAPTQTGLGERSHLLSKDITLDTFIDDIVNHLFWNDLEGVTLVGHSFGGVITIGVADRVPERLDRMVFLDGAIIKNGRAGSASCPRRLPTTASLRHRKAAAVCHCPRPRRKATASPILNR